MLTATDIHYIVGLLSRATHPDSVDVDMGNYVLDEASETRRDVDVTITVRNLDGSISVFKGIEVKAHSRKLGSEAVEQLTQKMKDMPAITHRAIVSASGFTGPAVKKAKKHGVELYELKEWEPANDFEFFQHELAPAVRTEYGWAQLPSAHLNPSDPIPEGYRAAFRANPVIVFDADNGAVPVRLQEWLISFSKLAAKEAHEHCQSQPGEGIQHLPASVTMRFTDGAWALVGDTRIRVQEVRFTGVLERQTRQVRSTHRALVRLGDQRPVAGCCISDLGDFGLLALIITDPRTINLAFVPVSERNKAENFPPPLGGKLTKWS